MTAGIGRGERENKEKREEKMKIMRNCDNGERERERERERSKMNHKSNTRICGEVLSGWSSNKSRIGILWDSFRDATAFVLNKNSV